MSEEVNGEIHIDEEDATAGAKPGVMRWVLLVSLLSAIMILSIIWIVGAVMHPDDEFGAASVLEGPAQLG